MQSPPKPPDEAARLDSLRALNLLDTAPEERFDRLTRLAKRLFGVPIALVSLVDESRQWFKSCEGLDASETPRDISFCGHAILDDAILQIPDATRDERFRDNPLVTGAPHIRFYAGCPLKVPNGARMGTLCIIDREPRSLSDEDLGLLRDLAHVVEQELAAIQLATMDGSTGLSNRQGFDLLARYALDTCRRLGKPASMLFFELDRFKQLKQSLGVDEVDRMLNTFAGLLKQAFRASDVLGRVGGDQFAALVTNASVAELDQMLQGLRQSVEAHNNEAARGYDLTYTVGSVRFDAARHAGIADLLNEADALMYAAKQRA